jgi:hypothetical protein
MLLLPKYLKAPPNFNISCITCNSPILEGERIIIFQNKVKGVRHAKCINGRTRIAQRTSVRNRKKKAQESVIPK